MQRREIKLLLYCMMVSIVASVAIYELLPGVQRKTAVVDNVRLFDGYVMKKELEDGAKVKLQEGGRQLDSVRNLLQKAEATDSNKNNVRKIQSDYVLIKNKLEEDYKQSNHDINEQVWKRLNPLLDEYGKKKKLDIIIGANGMGTVLYTSNACDITNDVIGYVNKRYTEGN